MGYFGYVVDAGQVIQERRTRATSGGGENQ
jgi:hypothetical protein